MMRETAHEIDQAAADWAAKVDRGLSADEQSDLDAWLAADPRRAGAYGRMRAVALHTERAAALGPTYKPADFVPRQAATPSRRHLLMGSGAAAAAVVALSVGALIWLTNGRLHTRKGEIRQFALGDGSVVTLNTSSTIAVNFSTHRREIQLLAGEVLFDVAHDKSRPFVVVAGDTETRAVGTSFTVRHLRGEAVQVLVREGLVEVTRTHAAGRPLRLAADMRAISSSVTSTSDAATLSSAVISSSEVQRALAWRDGRIAFEGETLAAAANEFARYSDTRIVVEDPSLAREEIAGLYQANDPVGFAQSVATSLNAQTEVSQGEVRIFPSAS